MRLKFFAIIVGVSHMNVKYKFRQFITLGGDLIVLYASLIIALYARRFFELNYTLSIREHILPFSILFFIWIYVFMLFSLYDPRTLKNNLDFVRLFGFALVTNISLAIIYFYAVPFWGLAPKRNLIFFLIIFCILFFMWRRFFNRILARVFPAKNIVIFGEGPEITELVECISKNPQIGYAVALHAPRPVSAETLRDTIKARDVKLVAINHREKSDPALIRALVDNLATGVGIVDVASLYEAVLKKIPVSSISELWLVENIAQGEQRLFVAASRFLDIILSLCIGAILLPFCVILVPLLLLESPGPIIYRQKRLGRNHRPFMLYKFRTMPLNAEKDGPQWSSKNDPRVTKIGNILRQTHLDELPQIINILRGDLSLVGPRPERPEFVSQLQDKIPYYDMRHLVRPGFTGWAQVNYRYGSSVEDAYRKLQYDMYYIKNRSVSLYLFTIFKTTRVFFSNVD